MKNFLRTGVLFLLLFPVAMFNNMHAQLLSTYTYSYSTSTTYTAITGTPLVTGFTFDDTVFTNIPLGFTFTFEGVGYNSIGVSSNGFIWFGTGTASNTEYYPISDASANLGGSGIVAGVVAPFASNLLAYPVATLQAPAGGPKISYTTTGVPGAMVFTVQWEAMQNSDDPSPGTECLIPPSTLCNYDGERVDMQIILTQATSAITVIPYCVNYSYADGAPYYESTGTSYGQVGLRGASNADFANLSVDCGTYKWPAPAHNLSNSSQCQFVSCYPAAKARYTWTPPVVVCPLISSQASTNACSGSNGTINITATGTGTLSYIINNGTVADTNTTGAFTSLAAGTYTVNVSNAGCPAGTNGTSVVITNSTPAAPSLSNGGPVCVGDSLTLSTPTVAGAVYKWTGPNGFSSALQNPVIQNIVIGDSGVYSLIDSVGGCNSAAGTTDVVVNALPATPTAGSNSPVCVGDSIKLTSTTVAGATYAWTGPNTFAVQNPVKPNSAITDSGVYSVIASIGTCHSSAATVDVTINPAPVAPTVSNNGPLCVGDSLKLSATTVAGATYAWTGPNSFNIQNPVKLNSALTDSGIYTIIATVAGCNSAPATTDVVISPPPATPVAGNNGPLCEGASLQLSATGNSGLLYTWTGPNSFSVQNPVIISVSLTDSGTYTVVASAGNCVSAPATTHVVVNPGPAAPQATNNGPLCTGDMLQLNASTVAGATYSWTGPNNFSIQNPTINSTAITDSGVYSVVATVGLCSSAAATTRVVILPAPATPVAGNNGPLCAGTTLQLTATGNAGFTYTWTGPNNFNIQNPGIASAALTDSGTYTVIASAGSCSSPPATTHVTINPAPTSPVASSNSPLCVGDALQLNATSVNGVTYAWTGPVNFNTQNPSIPSVTLADSGLYILVVNDGNCNSLPDSILVTVTGAPAAPVVSNNGPVCLGSSLQLTAAGDAGLDYAWTGPNSFSVQDPSITNITYADTGVYTVIATAGSCSSQPVTTDVVALPIPQTPVATNSGPVCLGAGLQLTASTVANASYSWTGPNTFSVQNPSINAVAFTDSGMYYLAVTVNGCTSNMDSTDVAVIPNPAAPTLSYNGPVCSGAMLQLNAVTVNGATYSWTGPNSFSVQNPQIATTTTADSGLYSVIITVNGCNSIAATENVVVHSLPATPTIHADKSAICPNDTATICVTNGPYSAYSWNSSQSGSCVATSLAGNYYVTVTDANGCTAVSQHTPITVFPSPSVSISVSNDTLEAYNATNYQWYLNDTVIAGATSSQYVAKRSGEYQVEVTDTNGCSALSSPQPITVTGITNLANQLLFQLYPNPASEQLTVDIQTADLRNLNIRIFDATGKVMYVSGGLTAGKSIIDIAAFAPGVYVLKIGDTIRKFVKE